MTERYRQLLNLILIGLKPGQIEIAFQLIPALAKDQHLRPKHIDRHVWKTEGRFISPQ
jgi:hypothetical protein